MQKCYFLFRLVSSVEREQLYNLLKGSQFIKQFGKFAIL